MSVHNQESKPETSQKETQPKDRKLILCNSALGRYYASFNVDYDDDFKRNCDDSLVDVYAHII